VSYLLISQDGFTSFLLVHGGVLIALI